MVLHDHLSQNVRDYSVSQECRRCRLKASGPAVSAMGLKLIKVACELSSRAGDPTKVIVCREERVRWNIDTNTLRPGRTDL